MGNDVARHIANLPEALQPAASVWFERFSEQAAVIPDECLAATIRLVACSEFAAKCLLSDPVWFVENVVSFSSPPDDNKLADFVESIASSDAEKAAVQARLRRQRNRLLLRVLWREVQGLADLDETLQQLSLIADQMLDAATRFALNQLKPRFGTPQKSCGRGSTAGRSRHGQAWRP